MARINEPGENGDGIAILSRLFLHLIYAFLFKQAISVLFIFQTDG